MNPCRCGRLGDPRDACRCTEREIAQHWQRISQPLLDRIDLQCWVLPPAGAGPSTGGEPSARLRARIEAARERARARLRRAGYTGPELPNGRLPPALLQQVARPADTRAAQALAQIVHRLRLSPRATHALLRVARTLSDLEGREDLTADALWQAAGLRELERGPRQLASTLRSPGGRAPVAGPKPKR